MYDYETRRKWKQEKIRQERLTAKIICWYMFLVMVAFICVDKVQYVYSLTYNPVKLMDNHAIKFETIDSVNPEEVLNLEEYRKMTKYNSYTIHPKDVYEFYKSKGYNDAAIAGILANIEVESNFNAQERHERVNEVGDIVGGLGIYQWNGVRTDRLKNWAYSNGFDYENPFVQMAYMVKESAQYAVSPDYMNFTNSEWGAANAAYHFAASFEKCASKYIPKRTDKAVKWFNIIQTQYSLPNTQLAMNIEL